MGYTIDKKMKSTMRGYRHFIFYVSDMEELPASGHFRKMDAGREIVNQICRNMPECIVRKYTEYDGEMLNADSIGIVFPAHKWGISLAVYSFLQHLKFSKEAYVYAVVVGESISGGVDATVYSRLKILEQFRRILDRRCTGSESDIFIRCIDRRRAAGSTEEILRNGKDFKTNIGYIMEGLLFHSVESLIAGSKNSDTWCIEGYFDEYVDMPEMVEFGEEQGEAYDNVELFPGEKISERNTSENKRRLSNIYLDDDIFTGVRLCRVM